MKALRSESYVLQIGPGLIAGKFTTVEGLLEDIIAQLGRDNPFIQGDSATGETKKRLEKFVTRMDAIKELRET